MSHSNVSVRSIITGAVLLLAAGAANSETRVITQGSAQGSFGFVGFGVGNGTWSLGGGGGVPGPQPSGFLDDPISFSFGGGGLDVSMSYTPYPGGPTFTGLDAGQNAGVVSFGGFVTVTHPGLNTGTFGAFIEFDCGPCGNGVDHITFDATGSGTFTAMWTVDPSSNSVEMSGDATFKFAAPEPGTLALFLFGGVGLVFSRGAREKRRSQIMSDA